MGRFMRRPRLGASTYPAGLGVAVNGLLGGCFAVRGFRAVISAFCGIGGLQFFVLGYCLVFFGHGVLKIKWPDAPAARCPDLLLGASS